MGLDSILARLLIHERLDDFDERSFSAVARELFLDTTSGGAPEIRLVRFANSRGGRVRIARGHIDSGVADQVGDSRDAGSDGNAAACHCLPERARKALVQGCLDIDAGPAVLLPERLRLQGWEE